MRSTRQQVQELMDNVDSCGIDPAIKRHVITYVIAKHIACDIPIPTSPVLSARRLFEDQHSATVIEKLSAFNEWTVIYTDVAYRLTYQMWLLRYRTVHEPRNPMVVAHLKLLELVGSAYEIPENYIEAVNKVDTETMLKICYFADEALEPCENEPEKGDL